jgi:hypothetical protein
MDDRSGKPMGKYVHSTFGVKSIIYQSTAVLRFGLHSYPNRWLKVELNGRIPAVGWNAVGNQRTLLQPVTLQVDFKFQLAKQGR